MSQVKAQSKETSKTTDGPQVLAVFIADCQATKGPGSTLALVQGSSGKCRLYGRTSLANAFPEHEAIVRTLSSGQAMADHFGCKVITGRDACLAFVAEQGVQWDGREAILADKGKGDRKRGGARQTDYRSF